MPVTVAIGERKRRAIRAELSEAALQLLVERGFESVTIDDLARVAGVSRRTFFRYFSSKEDMVFAFLDQWAVRLADDIVARPADEDPVAAVLGRLVRETPALRQQERINREHLRAAVVTALARRLGVDEEQSLRPQILATIAFAPLDGAMFAWFTSRSNQKIGTLLDEALETFNRERDAMC